jgi:hypothetical protein
MRKRIALLSIISPGVAWFSSASFDAEKEMRKRSLRRLAQMWFGRFGAVLQTGFDIVGN